MISARRAVGVIGSLVVLLIAGRAVLAGTINPPAGPVAPTPGPEPRIAVNAANTPGDADSLYRITARGSYYLTENIFGVANKHGIEIAAGGVVLDLNGFTITGNGIGSGNFDGITGSFSTNTSGITVRNGTVFGWGRSGVNLSVSVLTGCVIEGVHATLNSGIGISVPQDSTVSRCTASRNTGVGFFSANSTTFEACTSSENNSGGFTANSGTIFRGCEARSNVGNGFSAGGSGSTFESCTSTGNTGQYGFDAGVACVFRSCVASQNTSPVSTSAGFECQGGCVFTSCSSYNNVSTNAQASGSTGAGFIIGIGSTITGCIAATNEGDGIRADDRCHILESKVNEAGFGGTGAAIRVIGDQCRVEGNHCSTSDVGFDIGGSGSFIIRNTSVNNATDYSIVANNFYGPIIDRVATASQGMNGPSAPGTLGSSDPNANYSR